MHYAVALVIVVLAGLAGVGSGTPPGYELALPLVCLLTLSATAPRIGVALCVTCFALTETRVYVGPMNLPLVDAVVLGLLLGEVLRLLTRDGLDEPTPGLALYALFVGCAVISALLSSQPAGGLHYVARQYAFYGFAYLLGLLPAMRRHLPLVLRGLPVVLMAISLTSIGLSIYRIAVAGDVWADHPYDAGPFGAVQEALPVMLSIFWPITRLLRTRSGTAAARLLEIALVVAVFLGFAKTGWLVLVAGFATVALVESGCNKSYAALRRRLLFFLLAVPLALFALAIVQTLVDAGSALTRAIQWVASLEYWLRNPWWGGGPGTAASHLFESVVGFVARRGAAMAATEPHGFVIKLLPEVGLIGLLAYSAFALRLGAIVVEGLRTDDLASFRTNAACLAVLVCIVAHLFVSPDIFSPRTWFELALVMALHETATVKRSAQPVLTAQ